MFEDLRRRLLGDLDRLRDPEGFLRAGYPRYHTLFGRDSLIAAWQTLRIDPTITASTLRVLARYQGRKVHPRSEEEPGKILHEHRFDVASQAELPEWEFPYYGSVDSTPLFLIVGDTYVRETGDLPLLNELWDSFASAYGWMVRFGDADRDGYLEYERKNAHGLFHQGWKDGSGDHLSIQPPVALVEVQGYAFSAYRAFASLAETRGEKSQAVEARQRAARIRGTFDRDFWIEDDGFYALGLDGAKRPRRAVTSNPGHLLFSGLLPREKALRVVERLFQEDLWTPFGVRTHATSEPDFDPFGYHLGTVWPHDNWFIYRGLRAMGLSREAERIKAALLRAYEELGRIPELYAVTDDRIRDLSRGTTVTIANPMQAWSSGALLDMISDR
ncbi:MAG: hypothetical protein HY557_05790 [Euryarchaeota archaeon]|nr:hypothetical protein [Euryarchaeota archaeon]